MAQGSGSATLMKLSILLPLLAMILTLSETSEAAIHIVGDGGGWSFGSGGWPSGKNFHAGDMLVFNYNPAIHNVVSVDVGGYNSCQTRGAARVYNSGRDWITLNRGTNYFICNFKGHCEGGMKIEITAN